MHREHHFMCEVKESLSINKGELSKPTEKNADDGLLRTFRIAIAATSEYSQYHINDQGINSDASDVVKKSYCFIYHEYNNESREWCI